MNNNEQCPEAEGFLAVAQRWHPYEYAATKTTHPTLIGMLGAAITKDINVEERVHLDLESLESTS